MTPPTPPPTAEPPPPRVSDEATRPRRLTRRTEGHLLGGVAGGIADHLRIDPVLVRVAFVVLALWPFPGFGLLVYLALVLVVPPADASSVPRAVTRDAERGGAFYVGVALLVVALLALLGIGSALAPVAGGVLVPLALIGVGVALWVSSDHDRDRDRAAPPPPATDGGPVGATASATVTRPTDEVPAPPGPSTPAWGGAPPPGEPSRSGGPVWEASPPPPRSPLGRVTLGAALVVTALLWTLDLLGGIDVTATQLLAAPLAVLGLGLLVGAFAGRARWLAWLAAPLALALVVAAVVEDLDLPLSAGVGDRTVVVGAEGRGALDEHRLGVGRVVLDLTAAAPADLDGRRLRASLGAGELIVRVPPEVAVVGTARVEAGELEVRSRDGWSGQEGFAVELPLALTDGAPTATVDLDLRLGAGSLSVRVVDPREGPGPVGLGPPAVGAPVSVGPARVPHGGSL